MAIGITDRAKQEVSRILEDQNLPDGTALRERRNGLSGVANRIGT